MQTMTLISLARFAIVIIILHAVKSTSVRHAPPAEVYNGTCKGNYKTYSKKECEEAYAKLKSRTTYTGLDIQQHTWQCDHMFKWLYTAANKTGGGTGFTKPQKDWLKGLLGYLTDALNPTTNRSGHGYPFGIRKEYRVATYAERIKFHRAINMLKKDPIIGPYNTTNKYDTLVSFHHGSVAIGAHGGAGFPPWHRVFLFMFEIALKQQIPEVSLLFWDSTIEQGIPTPHLSNLWGPTFFGNGDGDVTTGPFANWDATDGTKLTRAIQNFPHQLTTPDDIQAILNKTRYDEIACGSYECMLFEGAHNKAHNYVFGQMGDLFFSPNDPIFWLHHTYFDCLWEEFRQNSQKTNINAEYPSNFGQPPHGPQALIQPFNDWVDSPIRNIDGLSTLITSNYYKCDKRPACPRCGNSAYLYCDTKDNRCKPFLSSNSSGEGTAFVPAVIYCDKPRYGNKYGVDGVYLETYGVSYKGRDQAYYFGDYYNYHNISRPSSDQYRPKYAGYFPARRPKAGGREEYKPVAFTGDGRPCKVECYTRRIAGISFYGPCPSKIYINDHGARSSKRETRANKRQVGVLAPYIDAIKRVYASFRPSSFGLSARRPAEYFRVTCPCEFQQYTYCPTYIPSGKGCKWSSWRAWEYTKCSVSCGTGTRTKSRTRTKEYSSEYTGSCEGSSKQMFTESCSDKPCVGCIWDYWSSWTYSGCSATCGSGTRTKSRTRTEKISRRPSDTCDGSSEQSYNERCFYKQCVGCIWKWSSWKYTQCSVTCGTGTRTKSRTKIKAYSTRYTGSCTGSSSNQSFTETCSSKPCEEDCSVILCPMVHCTHGFVTIDCCKVCEADPCEDVHCPYMFCPFGRAQSVPGQCCPACPRTYGK